MCFIARVSDDTDALAIAAILCLTLVAGRLALPVSAESYEWAQYLLLGAAMPLAAVWLARVRRPPWLVQALAATGTAAALLYVGASGRWIALPIAAAQLSLTAAVVRGRPGLGE